MEKLSQQINNIEEFTFGNVCNDNTNTINGRVSLHHIFPVAQAITKPDAMGVCLVKPQFEAGREKVGKNGVVRDPATHREVLHNAMGYAAANGFVVRGLDFSPVKGPEGNIEYLMFVQKSEHPGVLDDSVAEQVVAASHSSLDK